MASSTLSQPRTVLTSLINTLSSLQALDLLDRRLVTRILVLDAPSSSTDEAAQASLDSQFASFHLVRSAQPPRGRGRSVAAETAGASTGLSAGAGPTYVVRTAAWNCSCAAFAFSAFPAERHGSEFQIESVVDGSRKADERRRGPPPPQWEFGGLSLDGLEASSLGGGGVPCCKHLLACVLAERWSVLGEYVEERRVGREEGAGLVGDI